MTDATHPPANSGLAAGHRAEQAVYQSQGANWDSLGGSRLAGLERRAESASEAAMVSSAGGGGQFQLQIPQYEQTYARLYDLHTRLQSAAQKAEGASKALAALQAGGLLANGERAWGNVSQTAQRISDHAKSLDSQAKEFLWGMHAARERYQSTETMNSFRMGEGAPRA